ncbi:hypothetical protein ACVWZK_008848 [Bradyrhizobium sp. GM0.4]
MQADLRNGSKRRERGRRGSCYDPSSMHSCMVTLGKRMPSFSYVFRISGLISSRVETVSSASK